MKNVTGRIKNKICVIDAKIENLVDDNPYKLVMLELWSEIWDRTQNDIGNNFHIHLYVKSLERYENQ